MILEDGKAYWQIMSRYHHNRQNAAIKNAAVRDLKALDTSNPAILRRIARFTALPSSSPPTTGPRRA